VSYWRQHFRTGNSVAGIPEVNLINWLLAFAPIGVLLVLMVGRNWGGAKAGPVAWLVALVVAMAFFGAPRELVSYSQVKGALLSVWVLYIIWAALFLFHIVDLAGSVTTIGRGIARVTENRVMQVLLLAWIFTTFLQGIAGYGVPVAVVAPLMVGMGFAPVTAVVTTSVGHSWSVTFGSLAASFFALAGVSESSGRALAFESAAMLGIACVLCGFGAIWAYDGLRAVRAGLLPLLLLASAMAGTQLGMALLGAYSLAAFSAGCVGLLLVAALARIPRYRSQPVTGLPRVQGASTDAPPTLQPAVPVRDVALAFSAYAILIVIVLGASIIEPLGDALNRVSIRLSFPETETTYGWTNAATASYRSIEPFGHAGAMLLYAAFLGYLIYRRAGKLPDGALRTAANRTVSGALSSSIGIVTMVGMALLMMESGMTALLAEGIAAVAEPVFPLMAPFIGVLGCFMTGSNTNSNILFGALQRDTATVLGLPTAVILAAQTTGGALGSMVAPAKIIVGCSTAGLAGQEGPVIRQCVRYGVVITGLIGVVTLIWSRLA
jgi:lactate permease